jgi:transposase-like protein
MFPQHLHSAVFLSGLPPQCQTTNYCNGSGIRDTARVLGISPTTVIEELKKIPSSEAG